MLKAGASLKVARLFLSAAHKSSGKTTLAIGLAAALTQRGLAVQPFKKGPDYIDPMWLTLASGRVCYNLDYNTQTPEEIVATVAANAPGVDLCLIEGNKGLHDGVDPKGGNCSAALAKLLAAPVMLVIDTLGMTRGIAPLVLGYQAFDRDVHIAGVILNKVGTARQEAKLRASLEQYTDVEVLGAVGRDGALGVKERHLGLLTPADADAPRAAVATMRQAVEAGVDLDRLLAIAWSAPALPDVASPPAPSAPLKDGRVKIAVAKDAAFGFYYADDLDAFSRAGAELCFFDTLIDDRLPDADGLFIGGGFPETHAAELAANVALKRDIAGRIRAGLPAYAECGGLIYLARSLRLGDVVHDMVGVIPADAVMGKRPQGRGLVSLEETENALWPPAAGACQSSPIAAHEFHYAYLENVSENLDFVYRMRRGEGIGNGRDGIVIHNLIASFAHLRHTRANRWVDRFVAFVRGRGRNG